MSDPSQTSLTFHKNTFFELKTDAYTIFVDPVFSRERRGRRVADEVRGCDYLLATSMTPWFDDTLDITAQEPRDHRCPPHADQFCVGRTERKRLENVIFPCESARE